MSTCRVSLLAAVLSLTIANMAAAEGWPQWRGSDRDGKAEGAQIRTNWEEAAPKLLWMTDGFGRGYASVSIDGERIYTTGNGSRGQWVVAADRNTGEPVWKRVLTDAVPEHGYPGSRCTPTIDGDRLYVITSDGRISCVSAADGSVVWQRKFDEWNGKMMSGWGYAESPLVDGDRVLCTPGGPDAMIVCLDKASGEEIWRSKSQLNGDQGRDGAAYSSIVISNAAGVKQYVQLVGRGVIGVRAEDGKYLWGYNQVANPTANIPTPVVSGDYVFASTGYGDGGAVLLKLSKTGDGVRAEEQYYLSNSEFQNHHGGMVLDNGYVYAGNKHNNGFPTCLDLKTGKIVWGGQLRGPGKGSAAVTMVGQQLIFRYQDGVVALIAASPEDYTLHGSFMPSFQEDKSWAHPVVVDGRLYLREQDHLMCYDVGGSNRRSLSE